MQVYNVGPDECYDEDRINQYATCEILWVVIDYRSGDYDGDGLAVAYGVDGFLYVGGLGHCSCYGPLESWGGGDKTTVDEFLRPKDSVHDLDCGNAIESKVRELLGA